MYKIPNPTELISLSLEESQKASEILAKISRQLEEKMAKGLVYERGIVVAIPTDSEKILHFLIARLQQAGWINTRVEVVPPGAPLFYVCF